MMIAIMAISMTFVGCNKDSNSSGGNPNVTLKGINFAQNEYTVQVGKTVSTKLVADPSDAVVPKCKYESDDPEIATVDASGKVTGVAEGEAEISATTSDGKFTAYCTVKVSNDAPPPPPPPNGYEIKGTDVEGADGYGLTAVLGFLLDDDYTTVGTGTFSNNSFKLTVLKTIEDKYLEPIGSVKGAELGISGMVGGNEIGSIYLYDEGNYGEHGYLYVYGSYLYVNGDFNGLKKGWNLIFNAYNDPTPSDDSWVLWSQSCPDAYWTFEEWGSKKSAIHHKLQNLNSKDLKPLKAKIK